MAPREVEIVAAFLRGETAAATAERFGLQVSVVHNYRRTIRQKVLGEAAARSTFTETVEKAVRLGLFSPDGTPAADVLERAIGHRNLELGEEG